MIKKETQEHLSIFLKPLTLAILTVLDARAVAEEATEAVLPAVMTTATRTETTVDNAPGSTSVVTRAAIEKTPRASVKELVSGLEGVVTGQLRGQSDLSPGIAIRGVSGQGRNLILIDGTPVNTSYAGEIQAIGGINVEDLQQVEVVRGPFSSLYGSNAMGGVVNFVTALPDKTEFRAVMGYGDAFETGRAQSPLMKGYVSAAGKFSDHFKAKLSYGWMHSGGYRSDMITTGFPTIGGVAGAQQISSTLGGTQYLIGNTGRGEVDKYDIGLRAEWKPTAQDTASFSYTRAATRNAYKDPESLLRDASGQTVFSAKTANASLPIRESSFLSTINDQTSEILTVGWQHRFADSRLTAKFARLKVDEWYSTADTLTGLAGGKGVLTPRLAQNKLFDLFWEKPLGDHLLLVGGQYKTTDNVANTYAMTDWKRSGSKTTWQTTSGGKERVISVYGDAQLFPGERLSGSVGARYERWTFFDGFTHDDTAPTNPALNKDYASNTQSNISPKVTLAYQLLPETRLKASWGMAFQAPSVRDLTRNYARGSGANSTTYLGNPNLKPETSQSADVGIEHRTPHNGLLKAYVFHTEISDMHSTRNTAYWPGTARVKTVERINVGKARIHGLELALNQPLTRGFRLNANATWLNAKILENEYDPASVGKRMTSTPKVMVNLGLVYDLADYYGTVNYQYAGRRYFNPDNSDGISGVPGSYDAYGIINAKIGYRMNRHVDLSLAVSNLADKKYYNSVLTEGRAWFAQARLAF